MTARRLAGGALIMFLATSLTAAFALIVGAATFDETREIIAAKDSEIQILRWGSGAIIGAMASAIGVLWGALRSMGAKLERKDRILLDEVKSAIELRAEFLEEIKSNRVERAMHAHQLSEMEKKIDHCQARKSRELAGGDMMVG